MLQALMAKRFPKIVAQLERADSSVEVCTLPACMADAWRRGIPFPADTCPSSILSHASPSLLSRANGGEE